MVKVKVNNSNIVTEIGFRMFLFLFVSTVFSLNYNLIASFRIPCSKILKSKYKSSNELKMNNENEIDLDLPEFIQNTNKVTVEVVKSILVAAYGDRDFARY